METHLETVLKSLNNFGDLDVLKFSTLGARSGRELHVGWLATELTALDDAHPDVAVLELVRDSARPFYLHLRKRDQRAIQDKTKKTSSYRHRPGLVLIRRQGGGGHKFVVAHVHEVRGSQAHEHLQRRRAPFVLEVRTAQQAGQAGLERELRYRVNAF